MSGDNNEMVVERTLAEVVIGLADWWVRDGSSESGSWFVFCRVKRKGVGVLASSILPHGTPRQR